MNIKLAENLQLLRKEKGLTQEELANKFNVTNQSISKWETGLSCPDISIFPEIAEFYQVSIDELLGYKPSTSLNTLALQIKSYIMEKPDPINELYRVARIAAMTLNKKYGPIEVERLIKNNKTQNLSFGQGDGGVYICGEGTLFVASLNDYPKYDIHTVRKVSKYLSKICDINTLKVLFGLFNLNVENSIKNNWTIKEIAEYTNLEEEVISKAINHLDIYFDEDEYKKTKQEKYSLEHLDQVPLLVTMLIPALSHFNNTLKDN